MDEAAAASTETMETHQSSAAAFVQGGIQDACEDACSICLEAFCDSNPSTVTGCKHEFHLQCILEWCQRSSQCPMCWQPIIFKDPTSQELVEGVERERTIAMNRAHNTTIFHHPTLGDFELQHLPVGATDAELEERIFQHLAAAAAMGRGHLTRRDGRRGRSGSHGRPQYLLFSADPNALPVGPLAASSEQQGVANDSSPANAAATPFVLTIGGEPDLQVSGRASSPNLQTSPISPAANTSPIHTAAISNSRSSSSSSNQANQDRAGSSDFQSFSDNLKSRLAAVSTKYKESFARSTRGWKERLFSRTTSVSDIGSEVRRDLNAGIATVSRMMERFETRENSRPPESPPCAPAISEPLSQHTAPALQPSIETEVRISNKVLDASTSCVAAPSGST